MKFNYSDALIEIINNDNWMIEVLRIVRALNLVDCWIGAGFVRNKVWDYKHGFDRTKLNDVDVIHYNNNNLSEEFDLGIEKRLKEIKPDVNWSVKNQARMNIRNAHDPYENCFEAISYWPETATSIAVKLNENDEIECIAPYGLDDLFNLIVKPTPDFNLEIYNDRITKKSWKEIWSNLIIKVNS